MSLSDYYLKNIENEALRSAVVDAFENLDTDLTEARAMLKKIHSQAAEVEAIIQNKVSEVVGGILTVAQEQDAYDEVYDVASDYVSDLAYDLPASGRLEYEISAEGVSFWEPSSC